MFFQVMKAQNSVDDPGISGRDDLSCLFPLLCFLCPSLPRPGSRDILVDLCQLGLMGSGQVGFPLHHRHNFLVRSRCRFAYAPAEATATHYFLLQ